MKKNPCLLFVLALLGLSGCINQDEIVSVEKSSVRFQVPAIASRDIPDDARMLITIQTPSGEIIQDETVIGVERDGEIITSDVLELKNGEYEVTDFMVLHNEEIIYAAPRAGSELSDKTITPLSYRFSVSERQSRILVDVLQTSGKSAGKFGYSSFKKPAKNTWTVGLFIEENGSEVPTTGWAKLVAGDGTSKEYELSRGFNSFSYDGDPHAEWTLVVGKDGFSSESTPFVFGNIPGHGKKPFKFVLEALQNPLAISASILDYRGSWVLTDAFVKIYQIEPYILLHETELTPEVNVIDFLGDPDKSYWVEYSKPGYYTDVMEFVYNELSGEPNPTLELRLSFNSYNTFGFSGSEGNASTFSFEMGFIGTGTVHIDWRDGTSQDLTVNQQTELRVNFSHDYADQGQRNVRISGDVNLIVTFINDQMNLTSIYTDYLSELRYLQINNSSFNLLDLGECMKLETLGLTGTSLTDLGIGSPSFRRMNLESLSSSTADAAISGLFTNTIAHSVMNGHVSATNIDPGLSEGAIFALEDIGSSYGWTWSEN
jgi:hypothetical protein